MGILPESDRNAVQHLTLDQLANYREGRLTGELLLAADDHIAACMQCRGLLLEDSSASAQLVAVVQSLRDTTDLSVVHLSYQDLQDQLEGTTPSEKAAQVEAHLRECSSCRLELQDLREFSSGVSSSANKVTASNVTSIARPRRSPYLLLLPLAAAIFLAAVIFRSHPNPAPVYAVSLHEGTSLLALDTAGQPVCPANVSPADCQTLAAILRDRQLPVPAQNELRSSHAALLSAPSSSTAESEAFHVVGPVGTAVLSDRPQFQWQQRPGAKTYRVEIFDVNYNPVLASPAVASTSWTPEQPLERGKVYAWQVTAAGKGAPLTAPKPPDPEARFEIVSASAASANPASPIPTQIREDLAKRCTAN